MANRRPAAPLDPHAASASRAPQQTPSTAPSPVDTRLLADFEQLCATGTAVQWMQWWLDAMEPPPSQEPQEPEESQASPSPSMWKGRAVALLSSVMRALVHQRDEHTVALTVEAIEEALTLDSLVRWSEQEHWPQGIKAGVQANLECLSGFVRGSRSQPDWTREQHDYVRSMLVRRLAPWHSVATPDTPLRVSPLRVSEAVLKGQAKRLLEVLREHAPQTTLSQAQHALARVWNEPDWHALRSHRMQPKCASAEENTDDNRTPNVR